MKSASKAKDRVIHVYVVGFLASGLRKILDLRGVCAILSLLNADMFSFSNICGIALIEPTCAFIKK